MKKRHIYLNMVSHEKALEEFKKILDFNQEVEIISPKNSSRRKTSKSIYANLSIPSYNACAMDGIAVNSKDTELATESKPIKLGKNQYKMVNTGEQLPKNMDSCIMIEDIEFEEEKALIRKSTSIFEHIRPIGEDLVAGEMILQSNHRIRPVDEAVLVASNIKNIEVYKVPKVVVVPTGNEIVTEENPEDGQIIDSNSYMISQRLKEIGAIVNRHEVIGDDFEILKSEIDKLSKEYDVVLIIAGSSAGSKDYTRDVLDEIGKVAVHGITIKPGKPTILATVNEKIVCGLPGYPVSSWLALENYVIPIMMEKFEHLNKKTDKTVKAICAKRIISSLKYREFVRVRLGYVDNKLMAVPLARGAGAAMSLVRADGFGVIPENREGIDSKEEIEVILTRPLEEIERTLMITGSHDLILDEISDIFRRGEKDCYISSTHVGSLGGLLALKEKLTHIASTHLLNQEDGKYNDKWISDIFNEEVALIHGVGRIQGLMVKKGNPLKIEKIEDILCHRFVNRQRGSGTRLFTDYILKNNNIEFENINGYDFEKTTHMDVAATIKVGDADVGMGVYSAAKVMDLDFIPLGHEDYEFAIYKENLGNKDIVDFIEALKSEKLKEKLKILGGYDTSESGEIRIVGEKN